MKPRDIYRLVALVLLGIAIASGAGSTAGADEKLARTALIEAAGLMPWPFRKMPEPFELRDSSETPRSLTRDFKGQVVLLYMFAEW